MKATEFRIGNYLHDREGRLCLVEELSCRKGEREIYAPAITGPTTGLPNKPISITGEWLLKFGFKHQDTYGVSNLWSKRTSPGFYFNLFEKPTGIKEGSKGSGIWVIQNGYSDYKYVHQLQNLYHALTGEELQLTN